MAKNFTKSLTKTVAHAAAIEQRHNNGLRLSDIVEVAIAAIKENPLNATFFRKENDEYFENLRNDIRERGVIVPLIVKKDNTLLAGHNRLLIARELGYSVVNVQYVENTLSASQEREFLIKDNLFRRQFSSSEWMVLYRTMYPNFEERMAMRGKGRPKKSEGKKWDTVPLSEETMPLDTAQIARETGQSHDAVRKQFQRGKKKALEQKHSKSTLVGTEKTIKSTTKSVNARLITTLQKNLEELLAANNETRKEAVTVLRKTLKELESA